MISKRQTPAQGGTVDSSPWQQASQGGGQLPPGAIRFGFQPDQFLLPEENPDEYVRFTHMMWAKLTPSGLLEETLAARIVCWTWRLQRSGRFEQYVVQAVRDGKVGPNKRGRGRPPKAAQLTDGEAIAYLVMQTRTYAAMSGYEGHLARCLHRDLNLLWALQRARLEQTARRARLLSGQQQ